MLIHDRATPLTLRRTPEGFLQMRARIGRAGLQAYRADEAGGPPGVPPDAPVRVYRPPEAVFSPASLASFAGKPVTLDHPPAMVDSGNWRAHAVGHSGGAVERDGDHVAADLVLTDAAAVSRAEAGSELSNGYWADFDFTPGVTPAGEPYDAIQRNIRGNHIALVAQGRCGPSCAVAAGDAASVLDADEAAAAGAAPPAAVRDCPPGGDARVARLQAEIDARDGEIAALKARAAADAASLERRATERASVLDAARRIIGPGFAAGGLGLDAIRRAAVAQALGGDAVQGRSDAYVAAAFDAVAALRAGGGPAPVDDPLARHLTAPRAGASTALQARDAYLGGAWKSALTPGDR